MEILGFVKHFLSLRQNVFKTRGEIKALQQQRLNRLLTHAYDHSSYYRQRFTAAGITRDQIGWISLCRYPTLSKDELIAHFNQLVTVEDITQEGLRAFDQDAATTQGLYQNRYHVVRSSGSTGTPHYFLYDQAAWRDMLAGIVRGALWGMSLPRIAGVLLRRPRILYVAATDGHYGGAMAVGDGIAGVGARQLFLDVNRPLNQWVEQIEAFGPNMVIGYPTAMKIMAEMAERGQIHPRIMRVISCGEPLSPGLRHYLENTLQAEVINFYGASESLALGVEGPHQGDMILFDDLNIVEVVEGEVYITCLYNLAQPLIRYHLTDRLALKPLGDGPFSRASIPLSRSEDVLWFEDQAHHRDFLHRLAVEGFCLEGLTDYQFVQTGPDSFTMLAVASRTQQTHIRQEVQARMHNILMQKQMEWVKFAVEFREKILPDVHTGKKRLMVPMAA